MLMQYPIRQFLKQNPEKSFAKKPRNRQLLKVVKRLNNEFHLRHRYSGWSRFLLDEHDVPREADHSWHYQANIIFSNGHERLLKITESRNCHTGRITYKVENGTKPSLWGIKHYKFVQKVIDYNNNHFNLGHEHHLVTTKPYDMVGFNNKYFATGNPDNERGRDYRYDTHLLENYCADLIKAEVMIHNLGISQGFTKGREW